MTVVIEETDRTYNSAQVCTLTGATYRQLDHWCSNDWLTDTAHGSGSQRVFDVDDLETVYHAVALIEAGFVAHRALQIGRHLVEQGAFSCSVGDVHELVLCAVAIPPRVDDAPADPAAAAQPSRATAADPSQETPCTS